MAEYPKRATVYVPEGQPVIGCIQIIHGMAEHQLRYKPVAEFFQKNGQRLLCLKM